MHLPVIETKYCQYPKGSIVFVQTNGKYTNHTLTSHWFTMDCLDFNLSFWLNTLKFNVSLNLWVLFYIEFKSTVFAQYCLQKLDFGINYISIYRIMCLLTFSCLVFRRLFTVKLAIEAAVPGKSSGLTHDSKVLQDDVLSLSWRIFSANYNLFWR